MTYLIQCKYVDQQPPYQTTEQILTDQLFCRLIQEPQPPTGGENGPNAEGWNAYRQLMAQYWANWSSSSNNESSSEEAKEGVTTSNQSQPPLPPTNHPSLPKDTTLS